MLRQQTLLTSDVDPRDERFVTGKRTPEGFYIVKNGLEQAISRGISYAPYADLVWCETGKPDLGFAREFAQAVLADNPEQLLAYNCSPSFNWKKNLTDSQIASFQEDIATCISSETYCTLSSILFLIHLNCSVSDICPNGDPCIKPKKIKNQQPKRQPKK